MSSLRRALSLPMLGRSLVVTAVVGSVLNLINQGDAMFGGGAVEWEKVLLTFCVPFCVSTYGAWSAYRASERFVNR